MPNDYLKKEPSKTDKMLQELAMAQYQMEKGLWSTSTLVIVVAMLTKQKPEDVAELMVNGDDKIKEFSNKINEAVKKLEAEKHPPTHKASADKQGHDHSHDGHDHAGHDHNHDHK